MQATTKGIGQELSTSKKTRRRSLGHPTPNFPLSRPRKHGNSLKRGWRRYGSDEEGRRKKKKEVEGLEVEENVGFYRKGFSNGTRALWGREGAGLPTVNPTNQNCRPPKKVGAQRHQPWVQGFPGDTMALWGTQWRQTLKLFLTDFQNSSVQTPKFEPETLVFEIYGSKGGIPTHMCLQFELKKSNPN